MNENSETVVLSLTDTNCRSAYFLRILIQDKGVGQGYGTGIRDEYETMMQMREPFKVAGHGPGSH